MTSVPYEGGEFEVAPSGTLSIGSTRSLQVCLSFDSTEGVNKLSFVPSCCVISHRAFKKASHKQAEINRMESHRKSSSRASILLPLPPHTHTHTHTHSHTLTPPPPHTPSLSSHFSLSGLFKDFQRNNRKRRAVLFSLRFGSSG